MVAVLGKLGVEHGKIDKTKKTQVYQQYCKLNDDDDDDVSTD